MRQLLKKVLRRAIRPIVLKVRNVVDDDELDLASSDFSDEGVIYPWLNSLMRTAVRESQGRLRPHFTWALLHAAHLAKSIGMTRISAMEFGVAGGNGLLALEHAADLVEEKIGVKVDVYGFDTGAGLPPPLDYRDLPNLYKESAYQMDVDALRQRLRHAELILGLVEETVPKFVASNPAPIGFMSIDVDYYTSTVAVLKILECSKELLMPRVHCYFDDVIGMTFSEFTGELLAIAEFNDSHPMRKISSIYGLKYLLPEPYSRHAWCEQLYLAHIFDHDLYGRRDGLIVRDNYTPLPSETALALALGFNYLMDAVPVEMVLG
jgi:hypothetical protein